MKLPQPFDERPFALQVAGGIVVPMVFGLITGFALGWNEIVYYILAVPIAMASLRLVFCNSARSAAATKRLA